MDGCKAYLDKRPSVNNMKKVNALVASDILTASGLERMFICDKNYFLFAIYNSALQLW